ncbi:MAG: hypothetical protein QG585_551 [Patescibacteria group bacterium]|jgi:hypothetical protein|nr:hypothetical protein [Patescibacteria group bacterium]
MVENQKNSSKVGDLITVLVPTAIVADALSLIPFVGNIVGPTFWIFASLYLWGKGFGLMNLKRLVPVVISVIAEFFPAIQAFPSIITAVVVIIVSIRIEEKTGVSILKNPTKALSTQGIGSEVGKNFRNFIPKNRRQINQRQTINAQNKTTNKNARIEPILQNNELAQQEPSKIKSQE